MDWLNVTEAGREAGVSADTIRRWCDQGRLPSVRTDGGHRRISRAALSSLVRDGSAGALTLTRETRDLAAVFENWRDQVESVRPFLERSFDNPADLERAAMALDGPLGPGSGGGLLGSLSGLARELRDAGMPGEARWGSGLDSDEEDVLPRPLRVLGGRQ